MLSEHAEGPCGGDRAPQRPDLSGKKPADDGQHGIEPGSEAYDPSGEAKHDQHSAHRNAHRDPGPSAEQQRRGLDSNSCIVLAILKRIDGVVSDGPEDRARIEQPDGDLQPVPSCRHAMTTPQPNAKPSTAWGRCTNRFENG